VSQCVLPKAGIDTTPGALGSGHLLAEGKLIDLFPDWPGEVFPLYALYPSRQLRAAKVRTFIDFTSDLLVNSTSA
jgi:DNA-binding transcriptional LysR family regulator